MITKNDNYNKISPYLNKLRVEKVEQVICFR